jgi:hypothetical protein
MWVLVAWYGSPPARGRRFFKVVALTGTTVFRDVAVTGTTVFRVVAVTETTVFRVVAVTGTPFLGSWLQNRRSRAGGNPCHPR